MKDEAEVLSTEIVNNRCKYNIGTSTKTSLNNAFKNTINDENISMLAVLNSYESSDNNKYISDDLYGYNGKYVNQDDVIYRIKVYVTQHKATYDITTISDLGTTLQGYLESAGVTVTDSYPIDPNMKLTVAYLLQELTLEEVSLENAESLSTTFHYSLINCSDAPYKVFALPYSVTNLRLAIEIGKKLGSWCYDIQLMPYCPVPEQVDNEGWIPDPPTSEHNKTVIPIYLNAQIYGYIYLAEKSTFNIQIPYSVSIAEPKIEFNTDLYRLCAPNGSASFEFNPALNFGVDYFDVDCTYKPINPYIHINPNFKGLYGSDFNDYRGLIFNGDYSIPLITDKWREYEINNKKLSIDI